MSRISDKFYPRFDFVGSSSSGPEPAIFRQARVDAAAFQASAALESLSQIVLRWAPTITSVSCSRNDSVSASPRPQNAIALLGRPISNVARLVNYYSRETSLSKPHSTSNWAARKTSIVPQG